MADEFTPTTEQVRETYANGFVKGTCAKASRRALGLVWVAIRRGAS